jgi:hypothetical protein
MEVNGQLHPPAVLTSGERAPSSHSVEGWAGPRAGLNIMEKRRIYCPYRESELDSSVVQPVTDWAIPAPYLIKMND